MAENLLPAETEDATKAVMDTDNSNSLNPLNRDVAETIDLATSLSQMLTTLTASLSQIQNQLTTMDAAAPPAQPIPAAPDDQVAPVEQGHSFINPNAPDADLARRYLDALLNNDRQAASEMIRAKARDTESVRRIYLHVFQPVLYEIGRLWERGQASVAQEHYVTVTTQFIMSQLYEQIFSTPRNGRFLIAASISKNLHEIGIRMVADFFELSGWESVYLGANTPLDSIVDIVDDQQPDLLAISAMLNEQVPEVAALIQELRSHRATRTVPVLVGGPPFAYNPDLWQEVGASATASDPREAVAVAEALLAGNDSEESS